MPLKDHARCFGKLLTENIESLQMQGELQYEN